MIAEKTADAIRGRKLAPFEPPTRAGAHLYRAPGYAASAPQPAIYAPEAHKLARAAYQMEAQEAQLSQLLASANLSSVDWTFDREAAALEAEQMQQQVHPEQAALASDHQVAGAASTQQELLAQRQTSASVAESLFRSMLSQQQQFSPLEARS